MSVFKDFESAITSGDLSKRGAKWVQAGPNGAPTSTDAALQGCWPTERAASRILSDTYQRPLRDQSGGPLRLVLRYDPGPPVQLGQEVTRIDLVGDYVTPDGTAAIGNMKYKYYLLQTDVTNHMDIGDLEIFVRSANSVSVANGDLDMKLELWVDETHMAAFDADPKKVFFDQFLTRLQDLSPGFLRTGPNWSNNNRSSPLTTSVIPDLWTPLWSQRTLPTSPRWSVAEGIPWEVHAWAANELGVDLWVCIPFMQFDITAPDTEANRARAKTYVEGMADVLKAELDPSLHLYLEYSNEAWNSSFTTFQWLRDQEPGDTAAQRQLFADMTSIVFDWFLERWYAPSTGTRDCRVKLMAMGQLVDSEWANTLATTLSCDNMVDALGAALYVVPDSTLLQKWVDDDDDVYNGDIPDSIMYSDPLGPDLQEIVNGPMTTFVNAHAALASSFGVDLYTYEGGPSLIGKGYSTLQDDFSQFQDSSYAGLLVTDVMNRFLDRVGNSAQAVPVIQFGYFAFGQLKDELNGDFLLVTDLYMGTPQTNVNLLDPYKFDAVKDFNEAH